jgi:hypothetical protein
MEPDYFNWPDSQRTGEITPHINKLIKKGFAHPKLAEAKWLLIPEELGL